MMDRKKMAISSLMAAAMAGVVALYFEVKFWRRLWKQRR